MNRLFFILCLFCTVSLCRGTTPEIKKESQTENINNAKMKCEVTYLQKTAKQEKKGNAVFTFTNTGIKPIYLLDLFTEKFMLKAFFKISINKVNGERVPLDDSFIGCIHIRADQKYKEILPGQSFRLNLPLDQHIGKTYPSGLPEGTYTLNISYINKWGKKDECVHGIYPASPVKFEVE